MPITPMCMVTNGYCDIPTAIAILQQGYRVSGGNSDLEAIVTTKRQITVTHLFIINIS